MGAFALSANLEGARNTALGDRSLRFTTGSDNIGIGHHAGLENEAGERNIVIGNGGTAADADVSGTIRIGTAGNRTRARLAALEGAPE